MRVDCGCLFCRLNEAQKQAASDSASKLEEKFRRAKFSPHIHSNAVTLTWAFYDGGVNFSGSIPVTATGKYNVPIFTYYHSLSFFGRTANITASLPYGIGNFEAAALGKHRSAYRSGLLDLGFRFSVNLKGGPAMSVDQFSKWKQKTIIGASIRVEFHIPRPAPQTEEPIGSFEGHLSRDFGRGTWVSLDGNFWWGGVTTLNGIRNPETRQTSSRLGGTAAFRVSRHQSIKVSYSGGTYIRFGGNWQNVAVAWQYSWLGKPF